MKRIVSMLMAMLMLLTCGVASAETLTGTAQGFGGDVTVTVEVTDGVITSIAAAGASETEAIGGAAITTINAALAQLVGKAPADANLSVDTVSGATVTSDAVRIALSIAVTGEAPAEEPAKIAKDTTTVDMEALSAWLADRNNVAAARSARAFLPGEENAPTDEELERILHTANNYMWCHMLSAAHFIVIRDPEEQKLLLGDMGVTGDGTVTVLVLADGVADQEHHVEPYTGRDAGWDVEHYWQMYYCIYEAGEAASMLNLAAIAEGYRVRSYGYLNLYNQGVKDQFPEGNGISGWYAGGNFDYILGENWDISKYCTSKDGTEKFDHFFYGGMVDGEMTGRNVDVEGNLTLLCAITIGKVDETDVATGATGISTGYGMNDNYDFWD